MGHGRDFEIHRRLRDSAKHHRIRHELDRVRRHEECRLVPVRDHDWLVLIVLLALQVWHGVPWSDGTLH